MLIMNKKLKNIRIKLDSKLVYLIKSETKALKSKGIHKLQGDIIVQIIESHYNLDNKWFSENLLMLGGRVICCFFKQKNKKVKKKVKKKVTIWNIVVSLHHIS